MQQLEDRLAAIPPAPLPDCDVSFRNNGTYMFTVPRSQYPHNWARVITGVDKSKRGGFALQGDWLRNGETAALPVGSILVVGGKLKKDQVEGPQDFALFVVTPVRLVVFRRSNRVSVDYTAELLAMTPEERVETVLVEILREADSNLGKLAALDRDQYATELSLISERTLAWLEIKERTEKYLSAVDPETNITDIDSAVAAIVAAGYRTLALKNHPDKGGSAAIMALLSDGKKQLTELINLIKQERNN